MNNTTEDMTFNVKALRECIKKGYANATIVQTKCGVGYVKAASAIDWMVSMGYVSALDKNVKRKILISEADFLKEYSAYLPDKD